MLCGRTSRQVAELIVAEVHVLVHTVHTESILRSVCLCQDMTSLEELTYVLQILSRPLPSFM